MKRIMALFLAVATAVAANAATTADFLKLRASTSASAAPGKWLSNFSKAKSYATSKGVPLIAVWSNGDRCPHCIIFEKACMSSAFKTWMKSSGCVFVFAYYGDSGGGNDVYNFCYGGQTLYPLVRVYWPKGKVDFKTKGDAVDGGFSGSTGGKNAVSYFKKKLSKFKAPAAAPVKPYTIQFDLNGATNEMASVKTKVGATLTLPANTFLRPDYSFAGWAKTATGAVAYKNKASVKNLTTVSNGVVTLYAKWTRTTYRTYYTGLKYTIAMTDLKGWTASTKVAGMTWNKSTGKWSGAPTKAGTHTVKFKKGTSSASRKVVVVKDAVKFADESAASTVTAAGAPVSLDLRPYSLAGDVKSVSVTGLPDGLSYVGGAVTGASTKVGVFKVTVTAVSAAGQKLTRAFNLTIGVPDCCIGTFNGFVGSADTNRLDVLSLSNRGMFRLSAPSNANLSAKVVTAKATYAFTATGWTRNGDGTYTARLSTASGKDALTVTVHEAADALDESFCDIGSFVPSYGTAYDVWAQRSPFARDASGKYLDATVASVMPKVAGKWYLKATKAGSSWVLSYGTSKSYNLALNVAADGTATLAGKVGSYSVSASSAVFPFTADAAVGYVRSDFAVPVTVSKTKKTLDFWINLWFDRSNSHVSARGEGVGMATIEAFR